MTVLTTVKKDKIDNILHTINNTPKNMKFTKEEEHDKQLAFLDVLLLTGNDDGDQIHKFIAKTRTPINY